VTDAVPSATRLLRDIGITDISHVPEWALERGRHVHRALEFFDQGDLDEDSVVEEFRGYVESWKRFRTAHDPEIVRVEHRFESPLWRVSARPDVVCRMQGALWVIERKVGGPAPWHALQTAIQRLAMEGIQDVEVPTRRGAVYLEDDNQGKLREHTNPRDRDVVLALLTVWRWKHGNGVDQS